MNVKDLKNKIDNFVPPTEFGEFFNDWKEDQCKTTNYMPASLDKFREVMVTAMVFMSEQVAISRGELIKVEVEVEAEYESVDDEVETFEEVLDEVEPFEDELKDISPEEAIEIIEKVMPEVVQAAQPARRRRRRTSV